MIFFFLNNISISSSNLVIIVNTMVRLNRVLWPPEKRKSVKCKEQVAKKNFGKKKKNNVYLRFHSFGLMTMCFILSV